MFDLARTPGHYRAISHSTQESSTATEEQQSLQLSGRDGCALLHLPSWGYQPRPDSNVIAQERTRHPATIKDRETTAP